LTHFLIESMNQFFFILTISLSIPVNSFFYFLIMPVDSPVITSLSCWLRQVQLDFK
jgi:hypothetical protein